MSHGHSTLTPCTDLSRGWDFIRAKASRAWLAESAATPERVDLPHSWNTQDSFQADVAYYQGWGSYRRTIEVPSDAGDDVLWMLRSEGFYGTGEIWLDGRRIAKIDGQYLGFELDVTGQVVAGATHLIGIRLTNKCSRNVLPGNPMPDFLLYGGLSGRVWLEQRPRVHIDAHTTHLRSTLRDGRATIQATIGTTGGDRVTVTLNDADGESVATTSSDVRARETELQLDVDAPRLWGIDDPYLYSVVIDVADRGQLRHDLRMPFGIREARFVPDRGFVLNGKRVTLQGANRHESMPGFGPALPALLHRRDAELLYTAGCNLVRLAHYPQHGAFLDACDELGILVYAELASWKSVRTGGWLRAAKRQLERMIRRDRSRPGIILWGLGNEGRSRPAYRELDALAKALDPDRATIYAENHLYRAKRKKTTDLTDVWGCNYEVEVIPEAIQGARTHTALVSETCNAPYAVRGQLDAELEQVQQLAELWTQTPFEGPLAGFTLWSFNDYATLRKKRYRRFCGMVDAWREPKLTHALMRARTSEELVVDALAEWAADGAGTRRVLVVGNADAVRLRAGTHEQWVELAPWATVVDVPFTDAELIVEATRGAQSKSIRVMPWGPAHSIQLAPLYGDDACCAVRVQVCDAKGERCRSFDGDIHIRSKSGARVCVYTPDDQVRVTGGRGTAFVMADNGGSAQLRATGDGLQSAEIDVPFVSAS